jgi:hypothetical protein
VSGDVSKQFASSLSGYSYCSAIGGGRIWEIDLDLNDPGDNGPMWIGEGAGRERDNEDRPRPRPVGGEEALWTEGLPFGFPTLPLLCLTSRRARAPKLNRRAKGVAGLLLVADVDIV